MTASFRRSILALGAIALNAFVVGAAFAAHPTARTGTRMVFDDALGRIVLFGGEADADSSRIRHDLNDTWEWTGTRWVRIYTETHHRPGLRPASPTTRCESRFSSSVALSRQTTHGGP